MLGRLLWAYLFVSCAVLLGLSLVAAHVVVTAPFQEYRHVISTNGYGEGDYEFVGVLFFSPGMAYLGYVLLRSLVPAQEEDE